MMNKKILALAVGLIAILMVGVASGAVLTFYGQIDAGATIKQSVLVDEKGWDEGITRTFTEIAGATVYEPHSLRNRAEISATVSFATWYAPDGEGVTATYIESLGYTETVTISEYSIPATITVEDLGDSVIWTIDIDMDNAPIGNGHIGYALVISNDHVNPAFQVHGNDGTDATYPWGTHLYSEYDNGWYTGDTNTEVVLTDGISATGERDVSSNPDGIFTVTISKDILGYKEFYWALQLMANTSDTIYPSTWAKWIGDASTCETATIGTEVTSITIPAGETANFLICYNFPIDVVGTYTITTQVQPS